MEGSKRGKKSIQEGRRVLRRKKYSIYSQVGVVVMLWFGDVFWEEVLHI
jgi:hypothetical protein